MANASLIRRRLHPSLRCRSSQFSRYSLSQALHPKRTLLRRAPVRRSLTPPLVHRQPYLTHLRALVLTQSSLLSCWPLLFQTESPSPSHAPSPLTSSQTTMPPRPVELILEQTPVTLSLMSIHGTLE
ncbi:hypothetical protein M408DRAFT_278007 [Serendipita vermifera MAFF 305830]|uniref:Uncharacterized protein n=1 Tax=Serendipita vermifera MAFF 305830 TaxID=933852 RepID=A0A0C2W8P9_SERVB|nr:hypothetical protein M408DRAFT_278007 [Serendipita vermifera MAFF 305830]